jgi:hypothetical protein
MKLRCVFWIAILFAVLACCCLDRLTSPAVFAAQQDKPATPAAQPVHSRITIEITGGEKDVAVQNASVYLKYIEERALRKDKKVELNVKTNEKGIAHVPDAPLGRALVQVIADGWKTYGRWFDISDANQTIKIHLDRPPKWY